MTGQDLASVVESRPTTEAASSWGAEAKSLFLLAWPLITAQLAQNALFITDVIMTGWLGPNYLAAGTLATAFFNTFLIACVGLVSVVSPLVAQALGARDLRGVRRTVQMGFWVALCLGVIFVPLVWNARPILLALGQADESTRLAEEFTQAAAWLFFPSLLMVVLRSFLSAHGATAAILVITVVGVAVNAALNYALMFGNWGFPRLELRGSGITTGSVNLLMFLMMLTYVLTHKRYRRYGLLHRVWRPDWARLGRILRIGTPIGLTLLSEVGLFSAAAVLMGLLGTNEVAAHAVALQFASMAFMVPLGLSQATTVRVGLAFGRHSREGIRMAGWTALGLTLMFMALTSFIFFTFPAVLVGFFLNPAEPVNTQALSLATGYLAVAALFQLVDGAQVSAAAALRGLSDTRMPMILALIGYWLIGLPTAYLCGFILGWRGVGIWLGLAAGLAFVAVVLTLRFARRDRLGLLPAPGGSASTVT